ncbi:PIN domain-containing protein [Fulvimarina sp. MAC8]|uniref:PIN domain-containing protein n=1 Tax=Fulvimarina sp. MAC8 TaxID=3162874 RepID=UPI0032EF14E3
MIADADVFLDSPILIYAAQGRHAAPEKREAARRIILSEDYCTSAQVLAEFYSAVTTNGDRPLGPDKALQWVRAIAKKPCQPLDERLVFAGIEICQRYQLSSRNGAIIAAAERLGAKTLYTEELSHGQSYGAVTAINPFL